MIYEMAVVANEGLSSEKLSSLTSLMRDVVQQAKGEVLVEDDWGVLNLAQATSSGKERGHFLYLLYKADGELNKELSRRLKISEDVMKYMIVRAAEDEAQAELVKGLKMPYSKKYPGSVTESADDEKGLPDKDRRRFSKRKNCWYTAKNFHADWKDPQTFSWLVNEFGKIAPARVSGVSRKHQRFVTTAIKRARQIGLAAHLSGRVAQKA